jgi:cytochrome c5
LPDILDKTDGRGTVLAAKKNNNLSLNIAIVLALLAPSMVFILAFMSASPQKTYAGTPNKDSVADRIRPVVTLEDIRGAEDAQPQMGAAATTVAKTPEALFQGACMACHSTGVANAPKLGDKAAWEPRAALGMDTLLKTAITGKGAMPPKGGSAYSDEQLSSVIEYMLTKAGLTVSN